MSISTSKWPALASTQPPLATARWAAPTTALSPVAVTMKSDTGAASSSGMTRKPSMVASSARSGATSVTITFAPMPRARMAMPRPHQP